VRPTGTVARAICHLGIDTVLTCIDPAQAPAELAGRCYDKKLIADLPAAVDPCGECGQRHTSIRHGPGFASPIGITIGEVVHRDGLVDCDLLPAAGVVCAIGHCAN